VVPKDFCVIDYVTTTYGDGSSSTTVTNVDCFYFGTAGAGAGGGGSAGGGGGGGASYPSNTVTGTVGLKVGAGITNAKQKLANGPCNGLLDTMSNSSGQTLRSVMNSRGTSDPGLYLSSGSGMAFYGGQTHADAQGSVPCDSPTYAWTNTNSTQVWVCDRFGTLSTGMAGVIVIHEMLHTLGLPEGGQGQMTSQQITDAVSNACGTA
jgi:hypothetical protein